MLSSNKRKTSALWLVAFGVLAVFFASHSLYGQQPAATPGDRDRGIQLYDHGDATGAIPLLQAAAKKQKSDALAWYYLGQAFEKNGRADDAGGAYKTAATIPPETIFQHYKVGKQKEFESQQPEMRREFQAAADSAARYLELNANLAPANLTEWNERVAALRDFAAITPTAELTHRARILFKAPPQFTDEAKRNGFSGGIKLIAILDSDGAIKRIIPLGRLNYGLTDTAIAAARQIRFIPATKDGQPVAELIVIDYSFNS